MSRRASVLLSLGLLLAGAGQAAGLQTGVIFTEPAPLAAGPELARRTLSPLTALRLRQAIADQIIDLRQERFALYLPDPAPPQGYGLMVFVSPWPAAGLPSRWGPVLDRHGMIFVSAANAGNDAKTFERREPLALLAARNVMARYPVDPARIYIAGFSGGSRVALRLALAYPDLFRGALLDAGSDPIGGDMPPPPAALFRRFQEASRLVYLTGAHDDFHMDMDRRSQRSMQDWCMFDVATETMPWSGHDLADPASFDRGLDALARRNAADPARLAECRARIDRDMGADLQQVEALIAGDNREAWRRLSAFDARYGGLATERTLALAQRLAR